MGVMLKKWLTKRKLSKFNSDKDAWEYRLHNQIYIESYSKEEPSSKQLDKMSIMSKCASAEKLVDSLTRLREAGAMLEDIPPIKHVSVDKGEITLTNYLTNKDGYPYPIAKVDRDLRSVLDELSTSLVRVRDTSETKHSYYCRKIKSYV